MISEENFSEIIDFIIMEQGKWQQARAEADGL